MHKLPESFIEPKFKTIPALPLLQSLARKNDLESGFSSFNAILFTLIFIIGGTFLIVGGYSRVKTGFDDFGTNDNSKGGETSPQSEGFGGIKPPEITHSKPSQTQPDLVLTEETLKQNPSNEVTQEDIETLRDYINEYLADLPLTNYKEPVNITLPEGFIDRDGLNQILSYDNVTHMQISLNKPLEGSADSEAVQRMNKGDIKYAPYVNARIKITYLEAVRGEDVDPRKANCDIDFTSSPDPETGIIKEVINSTVFKAVSLSGKYDAKAVIIVDSGGAEVGIKDLEEEHAHSLKKKAAGCSASFRAAGMVLIPLPNS